MEKKLRNLYVLTGTYILYTSIYVPGNEFGKKDDSNYYASDQNLLIRHHLLV